MAEGRVRKGGKKNRKLGRNTDKCAAYKARNQRERNKLRRIARCNGAAAVAAYKERLLERLIVIR